MRHLFQSKAKEVENLTRSNVFSVCYKSPDWLYLGSIYLIKQYLINHHGGAMRILLAFILLSVSFLANADTEDFTNFIFNGRSNQANLTLNTEATRTEYRTRRVRSTCYRSVYRCTRSTPRPPVCRRACDRNGRNCRRVCGPSRGGGNYCRYVSVPYACMRNERYSVEVFDHYVKTNVSLNFKNVNSQLTPNENFQFSASGDEFELKLVDSKKFYVGVRSHDVDVDRRGDTRTVNYRYDIELIEVDELQKAIGAGIRDYSFRDGKFSYMLGKSNLPIVHTLGVYRHKRVGRDILIFKRELDSREIQTSNTGQDFSYVIDFSHLNIRRPSKMRLTIKSGLNTTGLNILNENSRGIPKLTTQKNLIYR